MPDAIELNLDRRRRVLTVEFDDGSRFELPCHYLRTHSPSAEVRGHGLSEPKLLPGKQGVNIERIDPVGSYAVTLVFDDGHDTGIYSWDFLHELGVNMNENLRRYAERLGQSEHRSLNTDT